MASTVEIFHNGQRVTLHPRWPHRGQYTADPAHRPKAHQKYLEWTPSRLIEWAQTVGPNNFELTRSFQTASYTHLI